MRVAISHHHLITQNYDVGTPAIGVAELLQDTVQVLQLYGIPIRSHALHLYYSAFVTMSTCPLLQTLAQEHVSDTLPSLLSPRAAHLGREVRALVGHQYSAECVAYSPDGTRIVSGSKDCTLRVWSANTGEELGKIQGHTDWVTSTVFTPDGACIISGSLDCTVRVWSTGELQPLAIMQGHQQRVSSVAVSPDGTRIISGSWDATVRVWCSSSFLELERLEVDGSGVFSVAFSPKGDRIVSASSGTVHVFHAVTLECLTELDAVISTVPTAPNYFSCVTFSNTGTHIFAGTRSGKVRAWVVATYRELAVLEQKTGSVDCVSVSPDGTLVLSGDAEMGFISVWNAKSRREITKFHAHEKGILCIAFSPDGTCFVTGGKDKTLRIWVTGMYDDIPVKSKSWAKRMERIVFSTDGARVMSQSLDVTSQIPEEQYSTARVYGVTPFKDLGQVEPMTLFAFSPDGTQAAVASTSELGDRSLRVWDIVHFRAVTTLAQLPNGTNVVRSLVYSPDGTRIVCGKPGGDIQSWSAVTFEKLAQFRAHGEWHVLFVMFSADGECLFSSPGFSHIRMWSATTFKKIGDIALPIRTSMNCMSISQLASCVVAGLSDDTVRVWSAVTHQELARFDVHSMLKHVAFVSHGVDFLTLNAHGETRAWKSHDINNSACSFSVFILFY
jgi:WD40 repeat protein